MNTKQERNYEIWDIFHNELEVKYRDLILEYVENELLLEAECSK